MIKYYQFFNCFFLFLKIKNIIIFITSQNNFYLLILNSMDKVKIDEYFDEFINIISLLQTKKTKNNKLKSIIRSPLIIRLLPNKSILSESSLSKTSLFKNKRDRKTIGGINITRRLYEHAQHNTGIIDLMSDNGMRYFYYNIITYIFDNYRIPAPHTILLHVSLYAFLISFIISLLQNNPITIIPYNTVTNDDLSINSERDIFTKFIKISDIGDINIVGFNNSDECNICLNKYNSNLYKKVIVTPCKHYMCRNCINNNCHLANNNCYKCPFCNNVIKYGLL